MTGVQLKQAREARGWTQADTARRLKVTQAYVSMLEGEHRRVPPRLARKTLRLLPVSPTALPLPEAVAKASERERPSENLWSEDDFAQELGTLGYVGFRYLKGNAPRWNPAELLLGMLRRRELDARLREALPWVPFQFVEMDWEWLVREAKLHNAQNRLGFVMTLAHRLTLRKRAGVPRHFEEALACLKDSRLAKEDTLCHASMTQVERRWLRENRPPEALEWNLLTDLKVEDLAHAD